MALLLVAPATATLDTGGLFSQFDLARAIF